MNKTVKFCMTHFKKQQNDTFIAPTIHHINKHMNLELFCISIFGHAPNRDVLHEDAQKQQHDTFCFCGLVVVVVVVVVVACRALCSAAAAACRASAAAKQKSE